MPAQSLTDSHLNIVRQVLEGEMSHAELIRRDVSKSRLNAQHRVAVAVTILLIHAEQACCKGGETPWLLHRPGIEKTYVALLGADAPQVTVNASSLLGLHKAEASRATWLTPPIALVTIAKGFTPSSPTVVAFMRAAKRKAAEEGRPWLPWYVEGDETLTASKADAFLVEHHKKLQDPSFALAVLAELHGDEPARVAEAIRELPEDTQAAIVAVLSQKINPYLTR